MNFSKSAEYLLSLGNEVEAMKLGLDNITTLLEGLGNPQKNYLKVQIAGTNGKGSVCAFLDSICRHAKITTGLYTSPHLVSITERVKINGIDISHDEFARISSQVRETAESLLAKGTLEYRPTFFEQMTAIAAVAFADAGVRVAILETGLGGRYDAVTAARAEIAAITRIDLDHQEYLGDTILEIAAEKAAIITDKTAAVVLGPQEETVMALLLQHCRALNIQPLNDQDRPWLISQLDGEQVQPVIGDTVLPAMRLSMRGRHQAENAQTAVQSFRAVLHHLNLSVTGIELHIVEGLRKATHPGRLEYIDDFLLDGAHNPGGARALATFIDDHENRPLTLIFGAMKDKNVAEMMEILFKRVERVILTCPNNPRAMPYQEMLQIIPRDRDPASIHIANSVEDAVVKAKELSSPGSLILVAGSLYLVGEVRQILTSETQI